MPASYVFKTDTRVETGSPLRLERVKTMYGGKHIQAGDRLFILAPTEQGGHGLVARGTVTQAAGEPRQDTPDRQTPRVRLTVGALTAPERPLLRAQGRNRGDAALPGPEAELHFKFYRQATPKIGGLTSQTAMYLEGHFETAPESP